jgi:hypothetical protein
MFDSPFDFCPHCGEMVLLDQMHKECAAEHRCSKKVICPLQKQFSGYDFSTPPVNPPTELARDH